MSGGKLRLTFCRRKSLKLGPVRTRRDPPNRTAVPRTFLPVERRASKLISEIKKQKIMEDATAKLRQATRLAANSRYT